AGVSARVRATCGRSVPITNTLTRGHSNTTSDRWLDMALSALYRRAQVHDSDVSFVIRTALSGGCHAVGSLDRPPTRLDHRRSGCSDIRVPRKERENGGQAPGSTRLPGQPASVAPATPAGRRWAG